MGEETVANSLDFAVMVSQRYASLTKSEKRIADYIRNNQEESAFLSAAEMAERLGLSEATLVRFARTLNFASYPAMRQVLQTAFRQRVTHSIRLRGRLDDLRETGDFFERLVVSEIDTLSLALESVDRGQFTKAARLLQTRDRVFAFGVGSSAVLVNYLSLRLGRFGRQVIPMTTAGSEFLEPLLWMTDQDILIVICFFDLTPSLQLLLDYASEVKCPVIMITDTLQSLVGGKADAVLAARRGPMAEFHSLVVPMTIINTLLLTLANEDEGQVIEKVNALDHLRERLKKASAA